MKLSQNFSLREMTQSQTALRNDIDNTPNESQIENLKALCENVLQPLRDYYEAPIKITSGYRSAALCEKIGSSSNSQHCANNGAAADFEIFGYDNKEVASHIKNNFEFDQLILEYYNDSDINSGWIHCSFKSGANRKESLTKDKAGYQKWE
jgi:zinc D-Ala-D-Ala carboxypeptidase|tara:strand:+ start:218 stop:670 length:453 start_codon:yes stop_codon:yes gene_type:complete